MTASDSQSDFITTDDWHREHLLRPVLMGCATKNAKVVTIALGSLQRLIALAALRTISLSAIPAIIQTMNDCMSQGVDIQLKIPQTLLFLITNFLTIHGRLLANVRAFVLCSLFSSLTEGPAGICCEIGPPSVFQLHESRTAVVSSMTAATLRPIGHVHHRQGRTGRSPHAARQ
ncbi:hypothetical protein F5888DRAFT_1267315 [Russula emetica]|nr:hypothetical protein F5888DRAFT_1267315 [Russula emetica]